MEEELKTPKPNGGRREGAGRKPKDGVGTEFVGVKLNKNAIKLSAKIIINRLHSLGIHEKE